MKLRAVLGALVVLSGALFPVVGRADDAKASAPPPGEKSEPSAAEADDVRVRIGFNFNGGAIVAPATVGGGGFAFRLGVQANRLFGVYYQAMPMVFAGFSVGSASVMRWYTTTLRDAASEKPSETPHVLAESASTSAIPRVPGTLVDTAWLDPLHTPSKSFGRSVRALPSSRWYVAAPSAIDEVT